MTDGRQDWFAQDTGWDEREAVVAVLEEFGPVAWAVLNKLRAVAKRQRDGGHVKHGFRSLARQTYLSHTTDDPTGLCRRIVEAAAREGELDDLDVTDNGTKFTCRISGFQADEAKARAAARSQRQREKSDDTSPDGTEPKGSGQGVTERDGPHRSVTDRDGPSPTGQDRTGQDTSSLRSEDAPGGANDQQREDAWPKRLEPNLVPVAAVVVERLQALNEKRPGKPILKSRVGEIVADFPEHDHRRLAGEFVDYWLHGKGRTTKRSDWTTTYRKRCGSVPAAPDRPVGGQPAQKDGPRSLDEFRRQQWPEIYGEGAA